MKTRSLLFTLLMAITGTGLFAQTSYYVSPSGNNANSGTSLSQPWRTIQHAMDNAIAGSTVNITTGTYNEKVEVNVSGTPGAPIVFQNYAGQNVIVSGAGLGGNDAVIGIFSQSNIVIRGLRVRDNEQLDAQGILVEGACANISILDNEVSGINFSSNPNAVATATENSQPIIVYGTNGTIPITNLVISGNIVRDSRTGYSEGLAVNGNVDGFEVSDNTVFNISNIGIDVIGHEGSAPANDQARNGLVKNNLVYNCKSPYATAAGIYVDGGKDLVIENNVVHDCQWGIEVGCENIGKTTSGITVRNNIIYDNDDAALAIGGYDFPSSSGKVTNSSFTNNTTHNNDASAVGIGGGDGVTGEVNITYTENCSLENNLFSASNSANIVLYVDPVNSMNLRLDYNQYFHPVSPEFEYEGAQYTSLAAYAAGTGQDVNSVYGDPAFADAGAADFHLTAVSPAVDRGDPGFSPAAGETDLDGEQRVLSGRVDIGADEFDAALPLTFSLHLRARLNLKSIVLDWSTETEQGTESFIVQRSAGGSIWKDIGQLRAGGPARYDYEDTDPLAGTSFYRLRILDFDGSDSFSAAVVVEREPGINSVTLYPNPAGDFIELRSNEETAAGMTLKIYDAAGRKVFTEKNFTGSLGIRVSDWPAGQYSARLSNGKTVRFTVR